MKITAKLSKLPARPNDQKWSTIITEYKRSGLTIIDFCRQHSLNVSTFYKYKNRLSNSKSESFFELTEKDSVATSQICITVGELRIECGVNELQRVLSILQSS